MTGKHHRTRTMLAWSLVAVAFATLVALARWDRAARSIAPLSIEHRTIRLADATVPGIELPPPPAEMREAAAELERAAKAADEARAGLEQTKADLERTKDTLERQRREFEGLRADADANAADTRRQLDEARDELEARRQELQQASREAEERVAKARRDLEGLEQARLRAAAHAGIGQGLGRGRALDMRVVPDPRRARNPGLPPFTPNEATVEAAAVQRGAPLPPPADGVGVPPAATIPADTLRGQAGRIPAAGE